MAERESHTQFYFQFAFEPVIGPDCDDIERLKTEFCTVLALNEEDAKKRAISQMGMRGIGRHVFLTDSWARFIDWLDFMPSSR